MARDWSREPYRKLLLRPSSAFRTRSVVAQGFLYVLTREADDDGFLAFDLDFTRGCQRLCRLLGCHIGERRVVPDILRELISDGCLVVVGDRLHIKNLVDINRRRDGKPTKTDTRVQHESDTNHARVGNEPRTSHARVEHESVTNHQRTTNEPDASSEITMQDHSSETASRARDQVGREVGRQVGILGAEDPAPDRPSRRRVRCPASDAPERAAFVAAWHLPDIHPELPRFLDFHASKGNAMADWMAAWRTWLRNASDFARAPGGGGFKRDALVAAATDLQHELDEMAKTDRKGGNGRAPPERTRPAAIGALLENLGKGPR